MTNFEPLNNYDKFQESFSNLDDPRRTSKGNLMYTINEILLLTISSVLCNITSYTGIVNFGEQKLDWLQKILPFKNGIPSHDTLGKFFQQLNPEEFNKCFITWAKNLSSLKDGEIIAIDGKDISGAKTNFGKVKHIVSAFATSAKMTIGQQTVSEKSNEITAIPKLLDLLFIKDCIVTTDAMGCQKKIAKKIISKQANYVLQLKENHPKMYDSIKMLFAEDLVDSANLNEDSGHGRIETRICEIIDDVHLLYGAQQWDSLKSAVRITSLREDKKTGKVSTESRYYISSLGCSAKKMNDIIRKHWAIENNLHWQLDVILSEDNDLKNIEASAENMNIIRKMALNMIEADNSIKKSKVIKMQTAMLNDKYREKLLFS